jgi:hypothetical protein
MTDAIQELKSRRLFNVLVAAIWLALPFIAYRYWSVWDQLPPRMATHFGADGRPNGWMTPQQSLGYGLGMLAIMLTVFTAILIYASRRSRRIDAASWSLVALFYVVAGVLTYINDSLVRYNVSQASMPLGAIAGVLAVAIVVFITIFIGTQRGCSLPPAGLISEETHSAPAIASICLIPAIVFIAIAIAAPAPGAKLGLAALALVVITCAAMAWSGFHYVFTPSGVEIRTLGFRLRSIPANAIKNYSVDHWSALGGYGIRGIGDKRAYVWGKAGVRIKTTDGEIFLGHNEPGRIIHDLDLITRGTKQNS